MADETTENNDQSNVTPAETGGGTTRKATNDEVKALTEQYLKDRASDGKGGVDPYKAASMKDIYGDSLGLADWMTENTSSLSGQVDMADLQSRLGGALQQAKDNAIQYTSDYNATKYEDQITGSDEAQHMVYDPMKGIDYSKEGEDTPSEGSETKPEGGSEEGSTTPSEAQADTEIATPKATEDQAKTYIQKFMESIGVVNDDGSIDPEALGTMSTEDVKKSFADWASKNLDALPEGVDSNELVERARDIVEDMRDNAKTYNEDPDEEKGAFDPYDGVDFTPGADNGDNPTDDTSEKAANTEPGKDSQSSATQPDNGSEPDKTLTKGVDKSHDNAQAYDGVKDTDISWNRMAYGVMVGHNYRSYREALKQHLAYLIKNADVSSGSELSDARSKAEEYLQKAENEPNVSGTSGYTLHDPMMFKAVSISDSSVGGNDAINPYSSFNLDDDIVHDVSVVGNHEYGMGRCYSEMYESKQQILYLTMGIPKFRNLRTWLENAVNKELSELNDVGEPTESLVGKLGRLIVGGVKLAIELPWLPFTWASNVISSIKDYQITEYFYFRDNMPLYYRYVNTLMSEIAVGMGIYGTHADDGGADGKTTENGGTEKKVPNGANMNTTERSRLEVNLPEIMKEGPDIFKIMSRRATRMSGSAKRYNTDDLLGEGGSTFPAGKFRSLNNDAEKGDKKETGWKKTIGQVLGNFWTGLKIGALEGMNFVGFRIEKSDQASETFSNSTADSPLLTTLNQEVAKKREINLGAATSGADVTSNINRILKNAQNFTSNVTSIFSGKKGFEGTVAYMASGNGYFDLPKQWSGSAGMSRSLTFNMKLRARTGGDPVSIYQSIMIPLSLLMAAALPRAVGDTTYTSPFLVRAFCKGMFAVPAGIISSLSITRGASEFGWSLSNLPTVVDVSFTIEDLSPMLFLSIAGGEGMLKAIGQAFTNNTKMHEYINTLVGIGAKERYYRLGQLKRRLKTALLISKNTTFSATYRGYVMGDSSIVRSLMALTPYSWVKDD